MATSLGQLLDTLADHARAFDDSPAVRADAATALGHVGRALAQLRRDGVSPIAADQREQRVATLATACTELAARAPATEGTLSRLAAAAADTLAILHPDTTVASRWAAATAVAETVTPLAAVIGEHLPPGPAAQWLAGGGHQAGAGAQEAGPQGVPVQQAAPLQPPTRADAVVLDRPVPDPAAEASVDPAIVVPD